MKFDLNISLSDMADFVDKYIEAMYFQARQSPRSRFYAPIGVEYAQDGIEFLDAALGVLYRQRAIGRPEQKAHPYTVLSDSIKHLRSKLWLACEEIVWFGEVKAGMGVPCVTGGGYDWGWVSSRMTRQWVEFDPDEYEHCTATSVFFSYNRYYWRAEYKPSEVTSRTRKPIWVSLITYDTKGGKGFIEYPVPPNNMSEGMINASWSSTTDPDDIELHGFNVPQPDFKRWTFGGYSMKPPDYYLGMSDGGAKRRLMTTIESRVREAVEQADNGYETENEKYQGVLRVVHDAKMALMYVQADSLTYHVYDQYGVKIKMLDKGTIEDEMEEKREAVVACLIQMAKEQLEIDE